MKRLRFGLVVCLFIGAAVPSSAQALKAITGATAIGAGGASVPNAVIVIDGNRITRVGPAELTPVPPNATVLDARGKFVVPGLADMHNHARSGSTRIQQNLRTNLLVLLAYGVTTVFNPGLSLTDFASLKAASADDAAALPRFYGTGPIVTVKGGALGGDSLSPGNVAEARAIARNLKGAGVDAIKVSLDDISWASKVRLPVLSQAILAGLVDEAHAQGLKVYAHAPMLNQAKDALRAGADGLLHGIINRAVDQEFIDLMRRNRAVYVPTLSLYEDVADVAAWARRQSAHDQGGPVSPLADSFAAADFVKQFEGFFNNTGFTKGRLQTQRSNLKTILAANVPVVMGTDSGFLGILMGVSSQLELALMVEAGMSPEAALRAATIEAARMIGRDADLGSIEPGKLADLLVLDANPLDDIRNVRRIHRVIKGGTVHDPAELLSNFRITSSPRPSGR